MDRCMLEPWLCPPEAGVTDTELQVPGASGAAGCVPVARAHTRSVCQRDMKHTFSFPKIPSHYESPFHRDFPPCLTQAASHPVTQTGTLPASPTSSTARARQPEPGIGAGGSLPGPQRDPPQPQLKENINLAWCCRPEIPALRRIKSSRLSSRLYLKF